MIENSVCKRASDVKFRRSAIDGVTETIKLIRPQGLAFRRGEWRNEALHILHDDSLNHAKFHEMIKLISKFDFILAKHLDKIVIKSKEHIK